MKVGFDITVLYRAVAGVYYYRYRLLQALLAHNLADVELRLFNYKPLQLHQEVPPAIIMLQREKIPYVDIPGIKYRKLAHLSFLQNPVTEPVAHVIDQLARPFWQTVTETSKNNQLSKYLPDIDILHTSDVMQHTLPNAKTVTNIHDVTTLLYPEYHLNRTQSLHLEKFAFARERADAVIALSHHTRQDIVRQLNIPAEKVFVVHGGVDNSFCPLPEEAVESFLQQAGLQFHRYILHVGTIEPRKNLTRLVEAYAQFCKAVQNPPVLVLAGRKGWFYETVYEKVEALGLLQSVRFLHDVNDKQLPLLYNGAQIFVYPSLYEGFGLPPLEAMACGTAVIASNNSSLPEVIGDGGILINPKDTEAITETMIKLYKDDAMQQDLTAKGLKQAKKFSWQRVASETINVYSQLLNA